ncbi:MULTISPECIES: LysR family transcriptional regulator [Stenotrophomonas]|uniref:LysR family transcriptional regulator n=2 Tax=Stenotrophomonas maltophilia TaxID=40324 RepID=A0A2J0SLX9_STEMA|nr:MULTISPECIES: LysR family transcriptional regulator [Stenotrophomonas]MBA0310711.1 LysR family transcriptional regulator [Stenotrophomonas maltophilia]MBH1408020.1 LysR family transcriptional regulator [Stenotrophomonas maltophilia]MDQ7301753.1 LysR family transcriptional regulator [Stenotrophomonas sp. Sm0581]PJK98286.1 LysR family transcriptional regulator [Stenotrophomonas maltophilia]PJL26315.1 LysR family transcriptional regulator [Stenotrophomonas maltophilia]
MRSSFDLNTVRVFVAVVDEQSFSGAARLLALPSSNVSRHVASLERNLGVRLLERSTRHLRMTEAGTLLYARAKPLLDTLLSTEEELGAVQRELKGPLRMCIPTEAPRLLAPILAEFCSLHPGIELECDTRLTGLEVLREDIDLSLFFHRGPQDDSAFITRVLATLPSIVVAAPALLARTGVPHRVHELKRFPCITTASALKGQPWQFLDATGNIVKVSVRSRYRVNSGELAVAGARQGLGFAIVAAHPCQDDIADGRLQEVQLDLLPAPLQLLGAYSHRHSVTARVRALLEFIQARLQPAAPVLRPDQSGR